MSLNEIAKNMRERLLTLESDIDLNGWDQPNAFYVIEEVDNDPYLIKAAEFYDHPCDVLSEAPRLNPEIAKGVVLVNECWMAEVPPEIAEEARKKLNEEGVPEHLQDQILEKAMQMVFQAMPPSQNPDRIECRWVQCLLSDGTCVALYRKRGEEPQFVDNGILDGRVLDSLKSLYGLEASV